MNLKPWLRKNPMDIPAFYYNPKSEGIKIKSLNDDVAGMNDWLKVVNRNLIDYYELYVDYYQEELHQTDY